MYLLNQFNRKQRKDKGKKRKIINANDKTKNNYLRARTFRSVTAPFIDTAKEVRHWTALGLKINSTKTNTNKTKEIRSKLGILRDIKGLIN